MSVPLKRLFQRSAENRRGSPSPKNLAKRKTSPTSSNLSRARIASQSNLTSNYKLNLQESGKVTQKSKSKRRLVQQQNKQQKSRNSSISYDHKRQVSILDANITHIEPSSHKYPISFAPQTNKSQISEEYLDSMKVKINNYIFKEAESLQVRLNERLGHLTPADKYKKFVILKETFSKIIDVVEPFSGLLKTIKTGYEEWIFDRDQNLQQKSLKEQDYNLTISRLRDRNKQLQLNIDTLIQEKDQISTAMESQTKYSPKEVEKIVHENSLLKQKLSKWEQIALKMHQQENQMQQILAVLSKNNIDLEQLMKGQHKVNTEHSILTTEDEYEPIASGPPKMIERPKSVPKLDLSKIQLYESVESESENTLNYESSYQSESEGINGFSY